MPVFIVVRVWLHWLVILIVIQIRARNSRPVLFLPLSLFVFPLPRKPDAQPPPSSETVEPAVVNSVVLLPYVAQDPNGYP